MSVCVLDCSYLLAVVAPDEAMPASSPRVLDAELVAPWLWASEFAAAAQRIERRQRYPDASARALCADAEALEIRTAPATPPVGWRSPLARLQLAEAHRLTPYDAAYLELALLLDAPLATLDDVLAAAARRLGVPVLD